MKRTSFPVSLFHVSTRTCGVAIGVSEETPSSVSMLRRLRLSMMITSWPLSARCSDVGQPQKPSPPSTSTFFGRGSLTELLIGISLAAAGA